MTTSTGDTQELIRRELAGIGSAIRRLTIMLGCAIVGYALYFYLVKYQDTAMVHLNNPTDGATRFYIDGTIACDVLSGGACDIRVRTFRSHVLIAKTLYGDHKAIFTPLARLSAGKDDVYEFIACGRENIPDSTCGLFSAQSTTRTY